MCVMQPAAVMNIICKKYVRVYWRNYGRSPGLWCSAGLGALAMGLFIQSASSHLTIMSLGHMVVCCAIGGLLSVSFSGQHLNSMVLTIVF